MKKQMRTKFDAQLFGCRNIGYSEPERAYILKKSRAVVYYRVATRNLWKTFLTVRDVHTEK